MIGRRFRLLGATVCTVAILTAACAPAPPATPAPPAGGTSAAPGNAAPKAAPAASGATAPGAAAPSKPAAGGPPSEVVIASPADPPTLDPQKPGGPFGNNMFVNLYDAIAFYDASGKIVPWLATEWTRVADRQWRYKLRQDVKFTNGEELDANAVKFTVERMLEPNKVRSLYTFGVLEKVEVVDKYTFDVFTKQPDPNLPGRMTDLYILPPKYTAEIGEDEFGKKPIGSGAYMFVEALPNQRVVMQANPNFWGGKPAVDRLVWRTIPEASTRVAEVMSGGVDIVVDLSPEQAASLQNNPRVRAMTIQSKRVPYVGLNLLDAGPKELKDKRVRQAMNYAVDVQSIVKNILGGYGAPVANVFRKDFPGYDQSQTPYGYDPDKAKNLLAEAGYSDGFAVSMMTSEGIIVKGVEVAQAVVSQLGKVGIKVDLQVMEHNAYRSVVIGGQAQNKVAGLFLWNWGAKPTEADSALSGFLLTGAISSYYANPALDKLIVDGRQAQDVTVRDGFYKQIQAMLKEDAPAVYLYQADDLYGVSARTTWTPRLDQFIIGSEIAVQPK